jgi:hypothetical protein
MATNDEFYVRSAGRRLNQINASRLQLQTNLAISLAQGDEDDAATEIQQIANLDAEQANLMAFAQREDARNQPRQQKTLTQDERVKRFGSEDAPVDWRDALAVINHGRPDSAKVSEAEYAEGYNRMKGNQATRGVEQK